MKNPAVRQAQRAFSLPLQCFDFRKRQSGNLKNGLGGAEPRFGAEFRIYREDALFAERPS